MSGVNAADLESGSVSGDSVTVVAVDIATLSTARILCRLAGLLVLPAMATGLALARTDVIALTVAAVIIWALSAPCALWLIALLFDSCHGHASDAEVDGDGLHVTLGGALSGGGYTVPWAWIRGCTAWQHDVNGARFQSLRVFVSRPLGVIASAGCLGGFWMLWTWCWYGTPVVVSDGLMAGEIETVAATIRDGIDARRGGSPPRPRNPQEGMIVVEMPSSGQDGAANVAIGVPAEVDKAPRCPHVSRGPE